MTNTFLFKIKATLNSHNIVLLKSSIRCANNFECKNDVQLVMVTNLCNENCVCEKTENIGCDINRGA